MSEQKIPIPAMLYNSAVGGHVTNSQQIIDENLNREQNDINQETVGAVPYNSTTPNGMGRIVLKKNDNFKQVVEAQTNGNTIFIIKYDFTLTGDVTIPANCVLQFEGGSISGAYTITGNNTRLSGNLKGIFTGVIINPQGTWIVEKINSNYFTDITTTNKLFNLSALSSDDIKNEIVVESGNYVLYGDISDGFIVKSNTHLIINGIISLDSNNSGSYHMFTIAGKNNIHIDGGGQVVGDRDVNTHASEYGWCLYVDNSHNITVDGITCSKAHGDGIYFNKICNNIIVRNCTFNNCRRCGVSLKFGSNFIFENNVFKDTRGIGPQCALEVELDGSESNSVDNIYVHNNIFENNCYSIILNNSEETYYISNVHIENNIFKENENVLDTSEWGTQDNEHVKDITFINNKVENSTTTYGYLFYLWGKNFLFKNNYIKDEVGGGYPIQLNCKDAIIENNYMYFYNSGRSIIIQNTTTNILIRNNNIIRDRATDVTNEIIENNGSYNTIINNYIEGRVVIIGEYTIFSNNRIKMQPGGNYAVHIRGNNSVLEYNDIDANGDTYSWLYYLQASYCKLYRNKANNDSRYLNLYQASDNVIQCYELMGSVRPTVGVGAGSIFIDTSYTPAKMIYHNGSTWVNMDGSALS